MLYTPSVRLLFSLFLLCLFAACQGRAPSSQNPPSEEARTLGNMTEQSPLVVKAKVEQVSHWKGRDDWYVVTLRSEKALKGGGGGSLRILDVRLFPKQPSLFKEGEKVLVFLRELPPYTAWQEAIRDGIRYGVLGKEKGVLKGEEGEKVASFVTALTELSKKGDAEKKKALYLKTLEENPSPLLENDLASEIFQLSPSSFSSDEWKRLAALVENPQVSDTAKMQLVKGFAVNSEDETKSSLEKFFCLPPDGVCLLAAETLESRGFPQPTEVYDQAMEKGDSPLRLGLLSILGRHARRETYPLFEKYIAQEKDEKTAGPMVEALGELGGPQAEALVLKYGKDPRYYARIGALRALGLLKSEKGYSILEDALKTSDPTVVTVAAQALERIGTPEAKKTLAKYYEKGHHGYWEPNAPQHFMPKESK